MADNLRPADAPRSSYVNPIAGQDIGGSDWRVVQLVPLVEAGIISFEEMHTVMQIAGDDATAEELYGWVAGKYNKTGKEIAAALSGTQWSMSASAIKEKKQSFIDRMSEANKSGALFPLDPTRPGQGGIGWDAILGFAGRNLPSEEEAAATEERKELAADEQQVIIDLIKRAQGAGEITNDDASKARTLLDQWANNPDVYQERVYELLDDLNEGGDYTEVLTDLQTYEVPEERVTDDPTGPTETDYASRAGRYLSADVRAAYEEERAGYVDPEDLQLSTMAGVLAAIGAEENKLATLTPQQLDILGFEQDKEGTIIDRSKGVVVQTMDGTDVIGVEMTQNMYEVLRQREDLQEAYSATAVNTPALQEMLDLPFFSGQGPQMPIEDIAYPSLNPDRPFEIPAYTYGGIQASVNELATMSSRKRRMIAGVMARGEFLPGEYSDDLFYENDIPLDMMSFTDPFQPGMLEAWDIAKQASQRWQVDPIHVLTKQGQRNRAATAAKRRRLASLGSGGGGGGRGPTYSVPASLREIPDYKTLAERTRTVFDNELGRDLEDYELSLLADELKEKHEKANRARIGIHKEAWNDAVSGGSTKVDFTEVEEPLEGFAFDVKEKYEAEIDRNERVDERSVNRNLLMNSISVGERMI